MAAGLVLRHGPATLAGLNLTVPPGQITALLGTAGSGKTALLAILAGFRRAHGSVCLDGRPIDRTPPHRRGFGVVQQPDTLFARLSLADNVAVPLRLRRVARAARSRLVAEALDLMGIDTASGRLLPDAADAGLRARVMLARALVFGPRVLLLDEPFEGHDGPARLGLIAALRRAQTLLGATTLVATRHGADALAVADRIAVLRGGIIEQTGTPAELWDRPGNACVAGLLGESNRLPGVVEATEDGIALVRLACGPLVEATPVEAPPVEASPVETVHPETTVGGTNPGRSLQRGDRCVLSVRPDRIAIAGVPAAEMGETALDATLVDVQFSGDSLRLVLLIGSGAELVVRRPAAAGLRGLAIGRSAALAWQPSHASAFHEA